MGSKTTLSAFFVVDASSTYNALLGRDWIHSSWCAPSTLHQVLVFWNGGKVKVVAADDKPFQADSNAVEARYYDEGLGTIRFAGRDRYGIYSLSKDNGRLGETTVQGYHKICLFVRHV